MGYTWGGDWDVADRRYWLSGSDGLAPTIHMAGPFERETYKTGDMSNRKLVIGTYLSLCLGELARGEVKLEDVDLILASTKHLDLEGAVQAELKYCALPLQDRTREILTAVAPSARDPWIRKVAAEWLKNHAEQVHPRRSYGHRHPGSRPARSRPSARADGAHSGCAWRVPLGSSPVGFWRHGLGCGI